MQIDFEGIQRKINYQFENEDLLQQAFIRRSYSEEMGGQNNEVLEFIGDKALDLAVIRIMMEKFGRMDTSEGYNEFQFTNKKFFNTKLKEGQFTDIKKDLVQKKTLAKCMDELGFNKQMYMGYGDTKAHINEQDSVKEDLFEAIIGAVALDSDWNLDCITNVVESMIDFDGYFSSGKKIDYVAELQEWYQYVKGCNPPYNYIQHTQYVNLVELPLNPSYIYTCSLNIEGVGYFKNDGNSKAEARKKTAKEAYEYLSNNGYILSEYEQAVGEPNEIEAIRQVNELVQKKLIDKPIYEYDKLYDDNGDTIWRCDCSANGDDVFNYAYTKNEAKRKCAYEILCDLMGYDVPDDYIYEEE